MSRKLLVILAAGGSAALMLGALGFQYIGEMPPCKLCYWQRYGHVLAILVGAVALWRPIAPLLWIGALGAFSSSVIGLYHSGVERKWWEGPNSCTSGSIAGLTPEELTQKILEAPLIRCDDIPWEMFGLSMANYNVLVSFVLALIWVAAARRA
ncbi:disulfide bond formation protein B [Primorskyibacter sp. 2E233]|uniref:disulfide bond formation protein B n=1 Tax=Primorskyibacter sp. 2E233 TaxID=3413431 RepID=UPI003BF1B2F2